MSLRKRWPAASVAMLLLVLFSTMSASAGTAPNILIWQPNQTASASGEALLADCGALGEDAILVSDLFAHSSDLSDHEIVMGIVGFMPDTHVINGSEGSALEAYVQNGGRLFLEGGDCFNYDPEVFGELPSRRWRRG